MDEYTHLAFIGAEYAICGATVNELNPSTATVSEATCPDCLDEHKTNERVNKALHRTDRVRPDYERG